MLPEERAKIKETILKARKRGLKEKVRLATVAGISRPTLDEWLENDLTFFTSFHQVWEEFLGNTVALQVKKDPWKILTADYSERFRDKPVEQPTLNIFQQFNNLDDGNKTTRVSEIETRIASLEAD